MHIKLYFDRKFSENMASGGTLAGCLSALSEIVFNRISYTFWFSKMGKYL